MAEGRPLMNTGRLDSTDNTPALPSLGFGPAHEFESHPDVYVSPPSSPRVTQTGAYLNASRENDGVVANSANRLPPSPLGIVVSPIGNQDGPAQTVHGALDAQPKPSAAGSHEAVSPLSTGNSLFGGFPPDSMHSTPDLRRERFSPQYDEGHFDARAAPLQDDEPQVAPRARSANDYQDYLHAGHHPKGTSIRSAYENDFKPTAECPTAKDIHMGRSSWVFVSIVLISLFSCVFSGIFLGLAIKGPRYGRAISSQGSFKPSDAKLLTTIMAKLIELSFVTVFVAFLGQVLSRRAFLKDQGKGVTISEMSMWRWVVQPGTLITHWETAKYAGLTILGVLSLLSAIMATLYTSAATAVVQPMLKDGKWEYKPIAGIVGSDFANINHIMKLCQTPVRTDELHGQTTCLQIEHAGNAYHNYQRYLSSWNSRVITKNTTSKQEERPQAFGLLYENTTVTGQWINVVDTPKVSKEYGRAVNNISLAMPHAGVFQASRDKRNDIMQPDELDSEGTFTLRASVVSPVMNVLCANMNEDELAPIVYDKWNSDIVNGTTWVGLSSKATTSNNTAVDELFGWSKKDPLRQDYPPVFAKLPLPFNTIMNHTNYGWGRDSVYLLGQGGAEDKVNNTGVYVLCKLHALVTPDCSTHYKATGSGGEMEAHCEDEDDEMAYSKTHPEAEGMKSVNNWKDVAFDWANSLSLNTGIDDAHASNARLLTQLILKPANPDPKNIEVDLDPQLPSVAEALAVMAGNTLLKGFLMAPFVDFYNYSEPLLKEMETQYFEVSIKAQQYASGGPDSASKAWILVLFLVFLMNIIVLAYFVCHNGLVTDFSEPPTLFALAVNSPPSHVLAGSCGGGPKGKQFTVGWFVNNEGDHLYMEPGTVADEKHGHVHAHTHSRECSGNSASHLRPNEPQVIGNSSNNDKRSSILSSITSRFGNRKSVQRMRPVSAVSGDAQGQIDLEDNNTRTRRQYEMLSNPNNRRSVFR